MSMASDTTARLLELPSLQTLVPDPSSQMPIPQTIVSINFFSSPSSSLLLPIFFLIPSLHTPMTSPAHLPRLPLPLFSGSVFPSLPSPLLGVTERVNTCAEVGGRIEDRFDLWERKKG